MYYNYLYNRYFHTNLCFKYTEGIFSIHIHFHEYKINLNTEFEQHNGILIGGVSEVEDFS